MSSGGISSYGILPSVISSHNTTPNDHWGWSKGKGVGLKEAKYIPPITDSVTIQYVPVSTFVTAHHVTHIHCANIHTYMVTYIKYVQVSTCITLRTM